MAPLVGLEPTTCGLTVRRSTDWAKEALCWHYLFSRPVTRQLSSAYMSLTSVFGMGTGGPSWQSIPTMANGINRQLLNFSTFICACQSLFQGILVTHTGFEPMLTAWEAAVLTTWPMGHLVRSQGLEPGTHWLRVSCSTNWAKSGYFCFAASVLFTLCVYSRKKLLSRRLKAASRLPPAQPVG